MIYRRGKNGIYSYRFRFAGRMIHESARTTSKTVAREAERNRRRELEERINGIKKRGLPPTFEIAAKEWQASRTHVQPKTISVAQQAFKHLLPAFGSRLLCDIDAPGIAEYQARRKAQGAQGRTINIEVGTLRQVLKAHRLWQALEGKVRMLRERHDIAKALTPEQERTLLAATANTDSACHTATVLALHTAMRKSEIRMLRWDQIDFEGRALKVGQSKTEAGTGRPIPLNPVAFEVLVRWAGRFPETKPDHYVFPWCENRHVDPTRPTKGWRTAWRHALKRAGFHCRFHDLRHTAATKLSEGQASEQTILAICGHISRRMLEHYSHTRMQAKRTALDAIAQEPDRAIFGAGVHQNVHQLGERVSEASSKPLN